MPSITKVRRLHPQCKIEWLPLSEVDEAIKANFFDESGAAMEFEPMALVFTDPEDTEMDIFIFGPGGDDALIREITGGISVAQHIPAGLTSLKI